MKKNFLLILTLIHCSIIFAQKKNAVQELEGYLIVPSNDSVIMKGCSLNMKSTASYCKICGDWNIYKNIGSIMFFVSPNYLDTNMINNFDYETELQGVEQFIYLSTNPAIVGNTQLIKKYNAAPGFMENQKTADSIQSQIEKLKLDYTKGYMYKILLKVKIKVIALPDRIKDPRVSDPMGIKQYAIIYDKQNTIELVKLLKSILY
jgi:hypothetical protein